LETAGSRRDVVGRGQSLAGEFGDHLPDRFPLSIGALFRRLQHVVGDIQCGSHASDASAPRINMSSSDPLLDPGSNFSRSAIPRKNHCHSERSA
jgi:hypothetical protein